MDTGIKPEVIEEIREIAKQCNITKVLLFGSRARGDFKKASDIDLAVSGGNVSCFSMEMNEDTSTLLEFDVVNLDENLQDELLEAILNEGKILYEKI